MKNPGDIEPDSIKVALLAKHTDSPYDRDMVMAGLRGVTGQATVNDFLSMTARIAIVTGKTQIIKIRQQHTDFKHALATIQFNRNREKAFRLHHPYKAWFIFSVKRSGGRSIWLSGNITPRLACLDRVFIDAVMIPQQIRLQFIEKLILSYTATACRYGWQPDLCLSNFGVDPHGLVYYIDDEYYRWDQFARLTDFLGRLLRTQAWIDIEQVIEIADFLRQHLKKQRASHRKLLQLSSGLRAQYVSSSRRPLLQLLAQHLCHPSHPAIC